MFEQGLIHSSNKYLLIINNILGKLFIHLVHQPKHNSLSFSESTPGDPTDGPFEKAMYSYLWGNSKYFILTPVEVNVIVKGLFQVCLELIFLIVLVEAVIPFTSLMPFLTILEVSGSSEWMKYFHHENTVFIQYI